MMNNRRRWLGVLLAALVAPGAQAGDEGDKGAGTVQFNPAPGVQVQARQRGDGRIAVRFAPSGREQVLDGPQDADGNVRLSAEDIDFDGRAELVARAPVGMVNELVVVYRYQPADGAFEPLPVRDSDHLQCGPVLMSLAVDAATRTVSSSCRSGPMWYTDLYRYSGPHLYLYRAERVLMLGDTVGNTLQWEPTAEDGPLAVWRTFDPHGKVLEAAIGDGLDVPASGTPLQGVMATVLPARLFLFERPGAASTPRYLVQGDRVELLDEQDGWLQVRYRTAKRGAVLGWINVNDG